MKFEKLNDTKIKIILSLQDMETNNLSIENVLSNSTNSQKLLDTIISKAELEVGFKPDDAQLLVEAIVPSNEECIFTITKLLDTEICSNIHDHSFIFKFNCFDDFIHLCTFLDNFSYLCLNEISKNFSLIYYNNAYYLKFIESKCSSIVFDYIKNLFGEFGKDVSHSTGIDGILNEYGKIIFSKNALLKCIHSFIT